MNPFPGNMGQIWQAKNLDEKPEIPLEFPAALKNLIREGWSKKPGERPEIGKFKTALSLMLKQEKEKCLFDTDETASPFFVNPKGEYLLSQNLYLTDNS
jgi:hypothetical protein